jgi:hypothetical protein
MLAWILPLIMPQLKEAAWQAYGAVCAVLREAANTTVTTLDDMAVEMISSRDTFDQVWAFLEARLLGRTMAPLAVAKLKLRFSAIFGTGT